MALPFTIEQFYGVFRDCNTCMWPARWFLVATALAAVVAALRPRPWSGLGLPCPPSAGLRVGHPLVFTSKGEYDPCARQVRNSAGMAVFAGLVADKAHWVEVARCHERFALQGTALGIRNAFVNQSIRVAALRPPFPAAWILTGQRPDFVVRIGGGPVLPRSLRCPVEAVLA